MSVLSANAQRGGLPLDEQPPTPTYSECDPLSENNPCIQTSCETELRPPISTNMVRPVNVLRPELTNRFDWTQRTYPLRLEGWSNSLIENPVEQDGNGVLSSRFGGLDQKDIKPEDGWELIRRDLGGVESPTGLPISTGTPYIILYNRYSSILRVFVARGHNPYGSIFTKITLRMNGRNVSSLFDFYKNGYAAIDTPYDSIAVSAPMQILDAGGKWGYADFVMNYDPCTCFLNTNHIVITVDVVRQSIVDLTGTATGRIATPSGMTEEQKGSSFSGVLNDGVNVSKNYVKGFTSFQKFLDESKKIVDLTHVGTDSAVGTAKAKKKALDELQKIIDNNTLLREGLKTVPYVSLALSIYDMFKGNSSSPTSAAPIKLAPMTFSSQIKVSGNITTQSNYDNITLQTPGSNSSNTRTNQIPTYDEVLGVFNLLETPLVTENLLDRNINLINYISTETRRVRTGLYKPLKYTLNPAAGVEIQDVAIQLVAKFSANQSSPNYGISGAEFNGKDADGSKNYVSDIVYTNNNPLLHFTTTARSVFGSPFISMIPKYYVQITVNYKRKDGRGNFVETYRFPANIHVLRDFRPPFNIINAPLFSGQVFVPASRTEITGFCNSPTYLDTRFDVLKGDDRNPVTLTKARKAHNLQLSPNPANDEVVLSYDIKEVSSVKAYITDLTGKIVSETFNAEVEKGDYNLSFPTQNLSNGIYLLVFEANGERTTQKLVISH